MKPISPPTQTWRATSLHNRRGCANDPHEFRRARFRSAGDRYLSTQARRTRARFAPMSTSQDLPDASSKAWTRG